jgi:hypothetical protein
VWHNKEEGKQNQMVKERVTSNEEKKTQILSRTWDLVKYFQKLFRYGKTTNGIRQ